MIFYLIINKNKKMNNIFQVLSDDWEETKVEQNIDNEQTDFLLENVQRSNAFYCLKNKKNISKKLFKTKMCMFVTLDIDQNGKHHYINNCKRENCHFAHTKEELNSAKCVFGNTCKYKNSKTRPCTFLHPGEDLSDFQERTGLERPGKQFLIRPITLS